ncbi:amidohydrolase family protein [candidate division KSB1 bacterium]|nr:amidohydrolase family protein [candidate division KSB1 bacterium]
MTALLSRRDFMKAGIVTGAACLLGCSVKNRFDILIKNGLVFDGCGAPARKIDVGIRGSAIEVIDELNTATADTVIDANGLAVSPGFIDIHTHTDMELLVNPRAESKLHQGVTTEVSGNCGYSPFPLNEIDFAEMDEELFQRYGCHVTWRDITGFLNTLEQQKISFNYATFTGHGNLRSHVVGKNDVQPTPEQMETMKIKLTQSIKSGSFGLSSGLEYAPGSYASTGELIELCRVVAQLDGVYATHIRNEDDTVEEAIDEALRICRETNVSLQISHLKACNQANWHKVDNMLKMIHSAADDGLPVHADRYPYIAYGTGLSAFLPLWSRQGSTEEILERLSNKNMLPEIETYVDSRGKRIGGWDRVVISSCFSAENKKWEGKSIRECALAAGKTEFEFIRRLLIEEKNRVSIVGFAMEENNLKKVLASPLMMIGSDGNAVAPYGKLGEGKPHPRFYGTFPRVLGKYAREERIFSLPVAIQKMTSMPAEKLGLQKRGKLQKGCFADIVIFNPETVIDNATFTHPHKYPTGIEYVIVNGKVTIENGRHTGAHAGVVLRKS